MVKRKKNDGADTLKIFPGDKSEEGKMRLLPLHEDAALFHSWVDRTLYTFYKDHTDMFTEMWEQQGKGYWLKFSITLRSVTQKRGYNVHLPSVDRTYFDEFFIDLTKLLTGAQAVRVHTYVKDVVSISRFHQLFTNVPDMFYTKETAVTAPFMRVFGLPEEVTKVKPEQLFGTLELHLRAVGCLLQLLMDWPEAEAPHFSSRPYWIPPDSWHYGNQLQASHYEVFLKKHFGDKFLKLVGVRVSDICWWNALPQGDRLSAVQERHTELGSFITKTCREMDIPVIHLLQILEDGMINYNFLNSSPRGKFYFNKHVTILKYVGDVFREFYLTDGLPVFHPFSQMIISFTNAAFAHDFWHGSKGIEKMMKDIRAEEFRNVFLHRKMVEKVEFVLKILCRHMIQARAAVELNSKFYVSLTKFYFKMRDSCGDLISDPHHWTLSSEVIRYTWNLPLCLNFLELVLSEIYEFERYFIPICYFPLRDSVVATVEMIYKKMSEAKFLAKSCLILADFIIRRENIETDRCYEARKLLQSALPSLASYYDFLIEDNYRSLDAVLKKGWTKGEREDGECCCLVRDRIKIKLHKWNTVPDVDKYFLHNFHDLTYWMAYDALPVFEFGPNYYEEFKEMFKGFTLGNTTKIYTKSKEPYYYNLYNLCAKDMKFGEMFDDPADELLGFIMLVMRLLAEDGWITFEIQENFLTRFKLMHDVESIKEKIINKEEDDSDAGLAYLRQLERISTVYYMSACILGDTWKNKLAGQNAFARLQRNEAHAIMADTGARLSSMIQNLNPKIVECPPTIYFEDAATQIKSKIVKKEISIAEVKNLYDILEKSQMRDIKLDTMFSLRNLSVPELEEMQKPKVGLAWILYTESNRSGLLQLVINKQLEFSKEDAKVQPFPLFNVLEFRLQEEISAMMKCLELGGTFYGSAYGLCRLVTHRYEWLQKEYKSWRDAKPKLKTNDSELSSEKVRQAAVDIRIRMLAAYIPLLALFQTYISKFKTTHPINEMTIDMLFEWAEVARLAPHGDEWGVVGPCLTQYVKALEKMGCEYMEQLLHHCKEIWVVKPYTLSPDDVVDIGSVEHAQQILNVFTNLLLLTFHVILTNSNERSSKFKDVDRMVEALVEARSLLRHAELASSTAEYRWLKTRTNVKVHLMAAWNYLLELQKFVPRETKNEKPFPKWYGAITSVSQRKDMFPSFRNRKEKSILQALAFGDFIRCGLIGPDADDCPSETKERIEAIFRSTFNEPLNKKSKKSKKKKGAKKDASNDSAQDEEEPDDCAERMRRVFSCSIINGDDGCLFVTRETTIIEKNDASAKSKKKQSKSAEDKPEQNDKEKNNHKKETNNKNIPNSGSSKAEDFSKIETESKKKSDDHKKAEKNKNTDGKKADSKDSKDAKFEETTEQNGINIPHKFRTCTHCRKVEPVRRMYKKCARCKAENWKTPRFYCSQECQVSDWKEKHSLEHTLYEDL